MSKNLAAQKGQMENALIPKDIQSITQQDNLAKKKAFGRYRHLSFFRLKLKFFRLPKLIDTVVTIVVFNHSI